jgi:hypothetical protein
MSSWNLKRDLWPQNSWLNILTTKSQIIQKPLDKWIKALTKDILINKEILMAMKIDKSYTSSLFGISKG